MVGSWVLVGQLKAYYHRPRPLDPWVPVSGWSFPSGHSLDSFVFYGLVAYMAALGVHNRAARVAIVALAVVLIPLVGLSRMYLGVHYLFDVVGGFTIGAVWLTVCLSGLEVVRRRGPKPDEPTAEAEQRLDQTV
jgi:undecaprenyl-diphosphatase